MLTLKSDCLRVEIAEPGEHPNDGVRFDRAGFITEVVLNNERHFCANEPKNLAHPSTGGRGLCCEMKLDLSAAAAVGERYPKFGVGLIQKTTAAPYLFYETYDIKYFPVSYRCTERTAEFETLPISCMGYALHQQKRITVEGSRLLVEFSLENVGEKPVSMEEYCHNFLSIDGMAISPDYVLEMPGLRSYGSAPMRGGDGTALNLVGRGHGFGFAATDLTAALAEMDVDGMSPVTPFVWRLSHLGAKAHVDGEESYLPSRLAVWAADHMVSPELMHRIDLKPGEKAAWTRSLLFVDELL